MLSTRIVTTLDVSGLAVRRGDRTVLDGLNASFPAGTVTAVTGANGAGKSTLLDVLAGVVRPTAGAVTRLPAHATAYVTQAVPPSALPITVRAVVRMGRWPGRPWWRPLTRDDRDVVEAQLERLGIAALGGRPLAELSGGQRQRTVVALGLAQRAPVVLVDEPTAGVDADSTARIVRALAEEAAAGAVVVHAAHDPAVVAAADRVLHLG